MQSYHAAPSTWQLQFDIGAGDVTFVWQAVAAVGGSWLTGYTSAGKNVNLGSLDISAALPGTFQTGSSNRLPLALAATYPQLRLRLSVDGVWADH